jgi:hypothetical protein
MNTHGHPEIGGKKSAMDKKNVFTKVLTIGGTILVWIPILAPLILTIMALITVQRFLFDYLMPAELFPFALVGGGGLLWASLRSNSHIKPVSWGLGLAAGMLVLSQVLAVASGLARGEPENAMLWKVIILSLLAVYCLAVVALGIDGIRLWREVFKKPGS